MTLIPDTTLSDLLKEVSEEPNIKESLSAQPIAIHITKDSRSLTLFNNITPLPANTILENFTTQIFYTRSNIFDDFSRCSICNSDSTGHENVEISTSYDNIYLCKSCTQKLATQLKVASTYFEGEENGNVIMEITPEEIGGSRG